MLDRYARLKRLNPRQRLGCVLLGLSVLAWAGVPIVPFLPLDLAAKGAWTVGLLIFAEITGWSAMPLLGPEIVALLRNRWLVIKAWFKRIFT
jgi:hypothetical protein